MSVAPSTEISPPACNQGEKSGGQTNSKSMDPLSAGMNSDLCVNSNSEDSMTDEIVYKRKDLSKKGTVKSASGQFDKVTIKEEPGVSTDEFEADAHDKSLSHSNVNAVKSITSNNQNGITQKEGCHSSHESNKDASLLVTAQSGSVEFQGIDKKRSVSKTSSCDSVQVMSNPVSTENRTSQIKRIKENHSNKKSETVKSVSVTSERRKGSSVESKQKSLASSSMNKENKSIQKVKKPSVSNSGIKTKEATVTESKKNVPQKRTVDNNQKITDVSNPKKRKLTSQKSVSFTADKNENEQVKSSENETQVKHGINQNKKKEESHIADGTNIKNCSECEMRKRQKSIQCNDKKCQTNETLNSSPEKSVIVHHVMSEEKYNVVVQTLSLVRENLTNAAQYAWQQNLRNMLDMVVNMIKEDRSSAILANKTSQMNDAAKTKTQPSPSKRIRLSEPQVVKKQTAKVHPKIKAKNSPRKTTTVAKMASSLNETCNQRLVVDSGLATVSENTISCARNENDKKVEENKDVTFSKMAEKESEVKVGVGSNDIKSQETSSDKQCDESQKTSQPHCRQDDQDSTMLKENLSPLKCHSKHLHVQREKLSTSQQFLSPNCQQIICQTKSPIFQKLSPVSKNLNVSTKLHAPQNSEASTKSPIVSKFPDQSSQPIPKTSNISFKSSSVICNSYVTIEPSNDSENVYTNSNLSLQSKNSDGTSKPSGEHSKLSSEYKKSSEMSIVSSVPNIKSVERSKLSSVPKSSDEKSKLSSVSNIKSVEHSKLPSVSKSSVGAQKFTPDSNIKNVEHSKLSSVSKSSDSAPKFSSVSNVNKEVSSRLSDVSRRKCSLEDIDVDALLEESLMASFKQKSEYFCFFLA